MFSYQNLYSLGKQPEDKIGSMQSFRRTAREGFNVTDDIDMRFFKLLFYFYNEGYDDNSKIDWFEGGATGLLAPTWLDQQELDTKDTAGKPYYKYNSAWAYLKNNFEEERASALKDFITLLSNISSESPWYFQKITGVDEALSRENWKVSEERKKITIECLADPVDRRIESLLSLYRSIVWSHARKCEILPSNLRKFDMGLFVFSGLISGLYNSNIVGTKTNGSVELNSNGRQSDWAEIGHIDTPLSPIEKDRASYKYIEFHNCEINMDSIKSGYGDLSNSEGTSQTFNIEIYFDDCYEYEYNPFILKTFGDFFIWDLWESSRTNTGDTADGNLPLNRINNISNPNSYIYDNLTMYMNDHLRSAGTERESIESSTLRTRNINTDDQMYYQRNEDNDPFAKIGDNAKQAAQKAVNQAKGAAAGTWNSIKNNAINALTGGLGNIYGNGVGVQGAIDAVCGELSKQISSLSNKITGNINGTVTDFSRSLTSAVTAPVLGTIKTIGAFAGDVVQATTNLVGKPLLGAAKTVENISKNTTSYVTRPINEAGEYIVNESNRLGTIAYNTQANFSNSILNTQPTDLGSIGKGEQNKSIIKQANLGNIDEDNPSTNITSNIIGKNRLNALRNINK